MSIGGVGSQKNTNQNGLFSGMYVYAATNEGLISGGRDGDYNPDGYGSCEFVDTVNSVMQFLIKMTALIAVGVFIYAGVLMTASRGDATMIAQAKQLFSNVLIGFFILMSAYLIINTVMGILVGGVKGGVTWQKIECTYAKKSAPAKEFAIENNVWEGLTLEEVETIVSSYDPALVSESAGVCQDSAIEDVWGSLASQANCIITEESACGALPISRVDVGIDKNPFSFGVMQINTTVHEVKGCQSLDIPDLRCLDAWSGRNFSAHVTNKTLYNACRDALLNPTCNMINAKRIYREAGNSWKPWSTAKLCGLR